jgi:hypothetical protein
LKVATLIAPSPSAAASGAAGRVLANDAKDSSLAAVTGASGWKRHAPNWKSTMTLVRIEAVPPTRSDPPASMNGGTNDDVAAVR